MKKVFYYLLMLFILIVMISFLVIIDKKIEHKPTQENELQKKLSFLNNIDKKIDYFHYQYLDRYVAYKSKYPTIHDEDIITQVNLNLDYPFYEHTKQSQDLNKTTILINKYIYLPEDYIPNNLVEIDHTYSISAKKLVYEAKEKFEQMAKDAKEQGYTIRAVSAYRSYQYQEDLYNSYLEKDTVQNVDTYSARPGYSEHQTGLVVDIDNGRIDYNHFDQTEEFQWMQENAFQYGFILRYPQNKEQITGYSYEAWHYRYVGKTIATFIKKHNLTLDEYYIRFIDK